jgi:cold-inducible RNA-binding protein
LGNKLYVGNLPFSTSEADLREMFGKHGALTSVKVITDRETGRSRGFGFVEYEDGGSAEEAQKALNGLQIDGRDLRVNEAHDKRDGGGGGGGGGQR